MTTQDSPTLAEGTTLAHYAVRSVLGAGGMGTVYLAEDTALDRPVALKVLRSEVAGDPDFVERFVREARAAARVSHPNLTHVYFVGREDGRPFFAMEYCPGTTLEEEARTGGPVELARGLGLLAQAARGLAAAHKAGVIHRDVKPSNLLVLPDGTVKVTDFGLAKSLRGDVAATAGRILGTPTYMSPEQVRGRPVDARTDVYLLGLTAWTLFAGRPPFASLQVGELINEQLNVPLPSLCAARPDLPPALGDLLSRMCAKEPERRPASMEEVAARLEGMRPRALNAGSFMARGSALALDSLVFGILMGAVFGLSAAVFLLTEAKIPEFLQEGAVLACLVLSQFGMEARERRTVGKWLLNLIVVRTDGTPPSWRQAALRFLIRFPLVLGILVPDSLELVQIGVLALQGVAVAAGVACYFIASGRTLSDLWTGTRVVYLFRRPSAEVVPPAP